MTGRRRRKNKTPTRSEKNLSSLPHLLGGGALLAVGARGDHRGLEQDALEDDALVGHVPVFFNFEKLNKSLKFFMRFLFFCFLCFFST